ncbi:IS200/IS605 family transposase [Patescibacteria group bacterium]|nr:IS200/IS605 family transposase [Patescibacteria group bacterium]
MEIKNNEKQYKGDNNLIYSCQYHVIFCPKYRRKIFMDEKIRNRFKEMIIDKQREYHYNVLDMDVMPDHIHFLVDVNPKIGVYSIVSKIKGYTSHQLREEFPSLKTRLPTLWTRSKFISSVGAVTLEVVKKYIEEQRGK